MPETLFLYLFWAYVFVFFIMGLESYIYAFLKKKHKAYSIGNHRINKAVSPEPYAMVVRILPVLLPFLSDDVLPMMRRPKEHGRGLAGEVGACRQAALTASGPSARGSCCTG